jgi:hypothetical protein
MGNPSSRARAEEEPQQTLGARAPWNAPADLESDETLAQLMDRGEGPARRELYARASSDPSLRARMHRIVLTAPLALPRFWLALLDSLGESVDYDVSLPPYDSGP